MGNQDRISEVYKGELGSSDAQQRARSRIDWLCSQARGRVLDLGCSQGITSILLARAGFQVVGAELEFDRLVYAEADRRAEPGEVASHVGFLLADGGRLPFSEATFDTVLLGELLEHVPNPELVVAEVDRALTDSGHAALTVPLGYHPHHDHKRTLYPGSALRLIARYLTPLSIDLVDGYIRILARRGEDHDEAWQGLVVQSQPAFEAFCLEVAQDRQRLHTEVTRVREQRDQARERLHRREEQSAPSPTPASSALPTLPSGEQNATALDHGSPRLVQATRWRLRRLVQIQRTVRDDPYWVFLSIRDSLRSRGSPTLARAVSTAKRRSEWHQAEHLLLTRVQHAPDDPLAWFYLAKVQRELQKTASACDSAFRAAELRPKWGEAALLTLELAVQSGRVDELPDLLATARLARIGRAQRLRRASDLLVRAGHYTLADSVAQQLLEHQSTDPTGVVTFAICQFELGHPADAHRFLEQHLENANSALVERATRFFLHVGDPLRARELIELLSRPAPSTLLDLGRQLVRMGALSEAREVLRRGSHLAPHHPRMRLWLDKAEGELRVLQRHWEPPTVAAHPARPRAGTVLHLVGRSLPQVQVGYTLRTQATARAQQALGLNPHVVTRFGFGTASQPHILSEVVDGIPHHRVPGDPDTVQRLDDRLTQTLRHLAELVTELRPSLLHAASDYRNALLALELGRSFELPVVYEVRGFWEDSWLTRQEGATQQSERYLLQQQLEAHCMARADHVVTLSEGMRKHITARGVQLENVSVVPNAVDPHEFTPPPRDHQLATSLGLASHDTVLGYVSSFVHYEGIHYLVEALAELHTRGHSVKVLLVGDGPERHRLEARARVHGLEDKVIVAGQVPHKDVIRYYGLIDIFVVPRTADRVCHLVTPLKPYEAMATARPLVVSGVDALRDMVIENHTGLIFQPEDALSLADTVEPLLDDPAHREKLGAAARDWVLTHHTWNRNAERYAELYRTLGAL